MLTPKLLIGTCGMDGEGGGSKTFRRKVVNPITWSALICLAPIITKEEKNTYHAYELQILLSRSGSSDSALTSQAATQTDAQYPRHSPPLIQDGYKAALKRNGYVLQRDWSANISHTKDEQFLDSEGPPPLDVPRKTTDMSDDIVVIVQVRKLGVRRVPSLFCK